MSEQSQLENLAQRSLGLLARIGEEAYALNAASDYESGFAYRHARNIHQLGADAVHLLAREALGAGSIIIRAMLESLFKLVAATKRPKAAIEILISEAEEDVNRIARWLDPVACSPAIKLLTAFANRLRQEYQISSNKKWTTLACAEAAELEDQYRSDYFCFSAHAHATSGGLLAQEYEINKGHALQTLLFIVICAAGYAPILIPTKSPQGHVDEAAALINEHTQLAQNGAFQKLNNLVGEEEIKTHLPQ